jgi:hypothetical protein
MSDERQKPKLDRRIKGIFAMHTLGVGVGILYLGCADLVPVPLAVVLFSIGLTICWRASGEIVKAILP